MSRLRTGIQPHEWHDEGPASAHITGHAFAISAVTVGSMAPVIRMTEPRDWRRLANAEAAKRYREGRG